MSTVSVEARQGELVEDGPSVAGSASELLTAMAALPVHHPSRAALRDRAIEAWLPLARHLAARFSGRGEPMDDLIQTATVGLIKSVDRFDPERGRGLHRLRDPDHPR